MPSETINNRAAFIWSLADLLCGDYKQSEYGRVILPFTVLRRLDCVIAPVKVKMLYKYDGVKDTLDNYGPVLDRLTDTRHLWNTSKHDLPKLLDDSDQIADNLRAYIAAFSPQIRDILYHFDIDTQITRLERANLLHIVVGKFAEIDLHPDRVSNLEMGYLYEELIRRFSGLSNETAGEHFTPREVIKLMVNLLFIDDDELLSKPGIIKTMFDPACGTGGMLSVAEEHLHQLNPQASLEVFGQELNPETFGVCCANQLVAGRRLEGISLGDSLTEDGHEGRTFDYLLTNPPMGLSWAQQRDQVREEHESLGLAGRFGAGLPRINDGSFLFIQHMISKMKRPQDGGSRLAIVFNGSPLFTGVAGSGESEIRRWIIENDWLEAVVALPDQLFYNTGISTYFWIVSNRKDPKRKGKVQLIDARNSFSKMRKSVGQKRKQISDASIAEIVRSYGDFEEHAVSTDQSGDVSNEVGCKIFPNESFGFMRITVDRPLKLQWEINASSIQALKSVDSLNRNPSLREKLVNFAIDRQGMVYRTQELLLLEIRKFLGVGKESSLAESVFLEVFGRSSSAGDPLTDGRDHLVPDPALRESEAVALPSTAKLDYSSDPSERVVTDVYLDAVDQYMKKEVHPLAPDAWVDHDKTKVGYEIPVHFFVDEPAWTASCIPLRRLAVLAPPESNSSSGLEYIPATYLTSGERLPDDARIDAPLNRAVHRCQSGDVVGRRRKWAALPADFGEALTDAFVIRPLSGVQASVLCEWLASDLSDFRSRAGGVVSKSRLHDQLVPRDLAQDASMASNLREVQLSRARLSAGVRDAVGNIFDAGPLEEAVNRSTSALGRSRHLQEALTALDDPVRRAASRAPHHVASLAQRYLLADTGVERYTRGLKLAEGTARVLGLLVLALLHEGKTPLNRKQRATLKRGMTFGSWVHFLKDFQEKDGTPDIKELRSVEMVELLDDFLEIRNRDSHAHASKSEDVALELTADLDSMLRNLMLLTQWTEVQRWLFLKQCDFTEDGYIATGDVVHGSSVEWSKFEVALPGPTVSNRLYVQMGAGEPWLPISPLAVVQYCPDCKENELFVVDGVDGESYDCTSLKGHQITTEGIR